MDYNTAVRKTMSVLPDVWKDDHKLDIAKSKVQRNTISQVNGAYDAALLYRLSRVTPSKPGD